MNSDITYYRKSTKCRNLPLKREHSATSYIGSLQNAEIMPLTHHCSDRTLSSFNPSKLITKNTNLSHQSPSRVPIFIGCPGCTKATLLPKNEIWRDAVAIPCIFLGRRERRFFPRKPQHHAKDRRFPFRKHSRRLVISQAP